MGNIIVSVVCTNYNKGDWIAEALDSFLQQETKFKFEILVIDDGSSDHSPDIIRDYEQRHPEVIRAFFNKTNIGITRTWIKVCEQARGKYIARCDGDDYWTDKRKLQKQVDLLEKDPDSGWCSTDYDIITPEGVLLNTSAFESGLVDRSTTYAEMLASKGFTMSSTWLVEKKLVDLVNTDLDATAVDDTFNIQLDLFNMTKLTYLPDSTVVYRINEGSDSRPIEMKDVVARHERLLATQLQYIKKYNNVDYREIIELALRRAMKNEMLAMDRLRIIQYQNSKIEDLESSLRDIMDSKKYRAILNLVTFYRKTITLPRKVVRKVLWLEGRRRYDSYFEKLKPSKSQLSLERNKADKLTYKPLISIIVPTYNTDKLFFEEMLNSISLQTYTNWQLVFIDDASPDESVRNLILSAAKADSRIKYKFLKRNRHIAGATNEGFKLADGEFVSLLDHDDILHPSALYEVARVLQDNSKADFIYTDEDKVNEHGRHTDPFIKPDWNEELLYSVNYITHFATMRASLVRKIGGERGKYNGAQDWDLFLRLSQATEPNKILHIPKILYSWRIHDGSTAKDMEVKPYVLDAQRGLLQSALRAKGLKDGQFSVLRNKVITGAWDVFYEGQAEERMHTVGDPVRYDKIKGIKMTKSEIVRNFGRVSLVTNLYKYCRYSEDFGNS